MEIPKCKKGLCTKGGNSLPIITIYNPNNYLPSTPSSLDDFENTDSNHEPFIPIPIYQPNIIIPELKELSSTALLIPPTKRPRLSSKNASEIGIIFTTSQKQGLKSNREDDSFTDRAFHEELGDYEDFTEEAEETLFSCSPFANSQTKNAQILDQFYRTNCSESNEPVFSVSGTQRLYSEDEAPFNLLLEFPIPLHYSAYRSGKWKKVKVTSCKDMSLNNGDQRCSDLPNYKGKSASIITGRKFTHPTYRLETLPATQFRSKFLTHLSLKMGDFDSEMEIKLADLEELLRGHPPTKRIKLDDETSIMSNSCVIDIQTSKQVEESETDDQAQQIEQVDVNESSVDFIFGMEPRCKKRKLRSNATFTLEDDVSSETDDEMKTIGEENVDEMNMINAEYRESICDELILNATVSGTNGTDQDETVENKDSEIQRRVLLGLGKNCPTIFQQTFNKKVHPEHQLYCVVQKEQQSKLSKSVNFFKNISLFKLKSFSSLKTLKKSLTKFEQANLTISDISIKISTDLNKESYIEECDDSNLLYDHHECSSVDHNTENIQTLPIDCNKSDDNLLANAASRIDLSVLKVRSGHDDSIEKSTQIRTVASYQPIQNFFREPLSSQKTSQRGEIIRNSELNQSEPYRTLSKPSRKKGSKRGVLGKIKTKSQSLFEGIREKFRKFKDTPKNQNKSLNVKSTTNPGESQLSPTASKNTSDDSTTDEAKNIKENSASTNKEKTKNLKKVSFFQRISSFFRRKNVPTNTSPSAVLQLEKLKRIFKPLKDKERINSKSSVGESKTVEDVPAQSQVVKVENEQNDEHSYLTAKHKDSVTIFRQKRMKLFEEAKEFYEDSVIAYRKMLTKKVEAGAQGLQNQGKTPFPSLIIDPSTLEMVQNPGGFHPARLLLSSTHQSFGYNCTLSESIILPAISRRKRRLNEYFVSEKNSEEGKNTEEFGSVDVENNSIDKPIKGILKNAMPNVI